MAPFAVQSTKREVYGVYLLADCTRTQRDGQLYCCYLSSNNHVQEAVAVIVWILMFSWGHISLDDPTEGAGAVWYNVPRFRKELSFVRRLPGGFGRLSLS
jgi:hypothetical protein